jgi:tetratricopeptide (TPR) repeat protein
LEKNDTKNAINNYEKAYQIDKINANVEGTYYSSSKLASILQRKQPEKALEYFNIALDCAKLTKDVFYIVSATLAIGDFDYDKNQNEIALKHYLNALDLAKNSFSQENINKIKVRINDIKFKIGAEKFDELTEIIKSE